MSQLISAAWTLAHIGLHSASLGFQCGWGSNNSSQHYSNSAERGLSPPLGTPSISEVTHLGHWPVKGRCGPARHRPAVARARSAGGKGKNWCGPDSPENQFQGRGEHSRHLRSSPCTELSSWPGRDGILGSDHKNGSLRMRGRKWGDHTGIQFPTCSLGDKSAGARQFWAQAVGDVDFWAPPPS